MSTSKFDNKTYEDINDILKRVSNRTLEMKTNNVKLLNKIGTEMNNLLIKAQEIVRFCINDRNDFMKEVELIQFDFIELGKKIDEQFSQSTLENSKTTQITQFEQTKSNKTNLQKILNTSESSMSEEDEIPQITNTTNKKSQEKFDLVIPDTCQFDINHDFLTKQSNNKKQFIIRDTIDSNYDEIFKDQNENRLETINESDKSNSLINRDNPVEVEKNLDETCLEEEEEVISEKMIIEKTNLPTRLNLVKNSQSTPLAVKKKLQEHGLLDLTNSPNQHESPFKPQSFLINNNLKNKNSNQFNSPIKYVQSKITIESPSPTNHKIKTPVKLMIKTPTKSPSLITKRPQFQLLKQNDYENQNENDNLINESKEKKDQNDSLDFSFEFREQLKKNSKNNSNQPQTSKSNSSLYVTNNNNINNSSSQFNSKKFVNQKSHSSDLNETGTPKKSTQNRSKKMKQLTMTQAFASQNDSIHKSASLNNVSNETNSTRQTNGKMSISRKESDKNLNKNKRIDLEETFMPSDRLESNNSNLKSIKIKDEPCSFIKTEQISFDEVDFQNDWQNNKNTETSNNPNLDEQRYKDLANEYFNDFDRVPKKKKSNSPNFKHVQVVRKQDERKKLATNSCRECENYWNSLPEEMRPKRMDDTCRHRAKYQAPPTPEHYWSIAFPTTQECIERGYGGVIAQSDKDDQISKRPRRKRPLKLLVNEDKDEENEEIRDFDFGE